MAEVINITALQTIKNWFKTGKKPSQQQFWDTWDSFWHKSEQIPISNIDGVQKIYDLINKIKTSLENEYVPYIGAVDDITLNTMSLTFGNYSINSIGIIRYDANDLSQTINEFPTQPGKLAVETSFSGSFDTVDRKRVTIVNGLITSIIRL